MDTSIISIWSKIMNEIKLHVVRFWARIIALIRLGFVYHDGHILFQLFIASDDGFFFSLLHPQYLTQFLFTKKVLYNYLLNKLSDHDNCLINTLKSHMTSSLLCINTYCLQISTCLLMCIPYMYYTETCTSIYIISGDLTL